jgi:signal transduction histidine kinase
VRIWEEAGGLLFEVSDDGAGFEPGRQAAGAGLTNMRDRLGAVGGTLRIESNGHGTRINGVVPFAAPKPPHI